MVKSDNKNKPKVQTMARSCFKEKKKNRFENFKLVTCKVTKRSTKQGQRETKRERQKDREMWILFKGHQCDRSWSGGRIQKEKKIRIDKNGVRKTVSVSIASFSAQVNSLIN